MTAEWAPGRDLETEGDRLETGMGTMVDRSSDAVSYRGAVVASGGGSPPLLRGGSLDIHFSPKWMELIYYGGDYCAEHGPSPFVELLATNVPPPYLWAYDLHQTVSSNTLFYVDLPWLDHTTTTVTCREADGAHTNLAMQASINIAIGHCPQSGMNIIPAMAGSTHDPGDPSDHEPELSQPETSQYGPLCPEATNVTLKAGWTHDTAILHIRNLVRILTYNPWDDETDHCIGLVWSAGGATNLFYYLADCCKPFADSFTYYVNGSPCNGILEFGQEPDEIRPSVFHVELRLADGETVLDRMWVVVYSPNTATKYTKWQSDNTSLAWTTNLPPVFSSIALVTNGTAVAPNGVVSYERWGKPSNSSTLLHHNAKYGMRSENVGEHGHQATYDENGCVITGTVAAGTADFKHPLSLVFPAWTVVREDHYRHDVIPYLRAMILDGNPCLYNNRYAPTNLNRPMLYQGAHLDDYLMLRPPIPTGMTER